MMEANTKVTVVVRAWAEPKSEDQDWDEFLASVRAAGNLVIEEDEPNRRALIGEFR